jgi:flagellar L-ring protein precursor FlgH
MRVTTYCLVAALLFAASNCAPKHIAPFNAKARRYHVGSYAQTSGQAKPATGSIYTDAVAGYLEDTRAVRMGDIVHIRINEYADAKGGASTALSRDSSREDSVSGLLGFLPALQRKYPDLNTEELVGIMSKMDFKGDGKTSREGTLKGSIAVRVKRELPNGDLFVEGTKVVMINNEEYHIYVSGLARPADIEMDNSVLSSLLADAQVEFTGRGDIATTVSRGWLSTILDWINPF